MRKTILITGATGSMGKATALELARRNCNLILVGRNERNLNQLKTSIHSTYPHISIDVGLVNLSELNTVDELCRQIKQSHSQLDGLIHAAATFETTRKLNSAGIELMFATNHLGPYRLTLNLLELFKAAPHARIMNISDPTAARINFKDLFFNKHFSPIKAYDSSKTANLLFSFKLAQMVSWTFVSSFVFQPGSVKSNLFNRMPLLWKLVIKNVAKEPTCVSKIIAHLMLNSFEETLNAKLVKYDGSKNEPPAYFQSYENLNLLWNISHALSHDEKVLA